MKKGNAGVVAIIIFIIIIAVLITGCQALRSSSQKKPLSEPRVSNERPLKKKAIEFSENIGLKKQIAKLEQEKRSLKEELDKVKSFNERAAADFNAQLKGLQDKLSQKDAQLSELNNSKNTLTGQLQETTAKLTALISANNYLEKQIEELSQSRVSLEKE